jgi:hypothetical protein
LLFPKVSKVSKASKAYKERQALKERRVSKVFKVYRETLALQELQGLQGHKAFKEFRAKQDSQGIQGETGPQGIQGIQGEQGDPGGGVNAGGTTGQVIAKLSNTDYDTGWVTLDALPSQTGNDGKFLTTDGTDASWAAVTLGGDKSSDGGFANSVYTAAQIINGGTANG